TGEPRWLDRTSTRRHGHKRRVRGCSLKRSNTRKGNCAKTKSRAGYCNGPGRAEGSAVCRNGFPKQRVSPAGAVSLLERHPLFLSLQAPDRRFVGDCFAPVHSKV